MSRANEQTLAELHSELALYFKETLAMLREPLDTSLDPETLGVVAKMKLEFRKEIPNIVKFLKDNDIVADIEVLDEMNDLKSDLDSMYDEIKKASAEGRIN